MYLSGDVVYYYVWSIGGGDDADGRLVAAGGVEYGPWNGDGPAGLIVEAYVTL